MKVAPAIDTPAALGGGLALHAQLQRVAAAAVVRPPRLRGSGSGVGVVVVDGEGDVVLLAPVERVGGQLHRLPPRPVLQLQGQRVLGVEPLPTLNQEKKVTRYVKQILIDHGPDADVLISRT